MMGDKIKPVHIANALIRAEHQCTGRMKDLKNLMTATSLRETPESRISAVSQMLERSRERWGRLGEDVDPRRSILMTRFLPLVRSILSTDGATFGASPDMSSFSSPSALTVTRDPSDDHAGEFVYNIWFGSDEFKKLRILDLLHQFTDPNRDMETIDDLTALLIPLTDEMVPLRRRDPVSIPLDYNSSQVVAEMRRAASNLATFEDAVQPNRISTLQRIILLGAISVFFFVASRYSEENAELQQVLLLDASNSRNSTIAEASEISVSQILAKARALMAQLLENALTTTDANWAENPQATLIKLFQTIGETTTSLSTKIMLELLDEIKESGLLLKDELPSRLIDLPSIGSKGVDSYLRLLGVRCGLLYPQQKNPQKRLIPTDRTIEVLVAGTIDLAGPPLEYRDFLDQFYDRWHIIVGGRQEDASILDKMGAQVPTTDLIINSERFLSRLEDLGLAKRLADTVGIVGLMEDSRNA